MQMLVMALRVAGLELRARAECDGGIGGELSVGRRTDRSDSTVGTIVTENPE
jgi:hypothetical protein